MLHEAVLAGGATGHHQTILYDRPLEAKAFNTVGRLRIGGARYRCELWLMPGAHSVHFDHGPLQLAELVTDRDEGLPEAGVLSALLCSGERDFEHRFETGVEYLTTVQTECLSPTIYDALLREAHRDVCSRERRLFHEWLTEGGPCLSAVMVETQAREVRIESFHFLGASGMVLRTGSIFQHA